MGLVAQRREEAAQIFKAYTNEQKSALEKKYTPAQIKAIEAGERAIDPADLAQHGVIRTDIGALPYYEDFSKTRSTLDHVQRFEAPVDPSTRPMTTREILKREKYHLKKIMAAKPPPPDHLDPESEEYQKLLVPTRIDELRAESMTEAFVDKNGPVPLNKLGYSYEAPGLPINVHGTNNSRTKAAEKEEDKIDERDPEGRYKMLMKQTGMTLDEILALDVKVLVDHTVVNQTRLGKIRSFYILAMAGNREGMLGLGQSKGQEIAETRSNAIVTAIRSMKPVPRYEERTIYGEVEAKVSAVKVKLRSRPPGG